jgi:hypothetical protein
VIRSASAPAARSQAGFWDQDLGYPHSFLTVMTALVLGLAFHLWVGYAILEIAPVGLLAVVGLAPMLGVAIAARRHPGQRTLRWLTGVPFAMTSTAAVAAIAVIGGVLPESLLQEKLGLESLWGSWPFVFATYLMLVNIIGSSGRRAWPLTYTNVVYLLSHLGLGIALIGGAFSGLSLERKTMVLFKAVESDVATNRKLQESKAPFTAQLKEFRMETFAPTLSLAKLDPQAKDGMTQTATSHLLKPGLVEVVDGHTLKVTKFYRHAAFDGHQWRELPWKTAAPAAHVEVTLPDGQKKAGWVSCGSQESIPAYLQFADDRAILMNTPRPKKFESDIVIDGKPYTVGVNQPVHVKGYDVYQFSYDDQAGAASQYSVIEIVRDPGLPVVYLGIFMLLAGTLLHLGNGLGEKK